MQLAHQTLPLTLLWVYNVSWIPYRLGRAWLSG